MPLAPPARAALKEALGSANIHATPTIIKVVVHVGIGKFVKEAPRISRVKETLARITGQAPTATIARKSISNFKVRKGMVIGYKVTLRGRRMWDFVGKLVGITFPRMRDFRGVPLQQVDAHGQMSLGFPDQLPFPESRLDDLELPHGVQVTIVTNAKTRDEAIALYRALGFPLRT